MDRVAQREAEICHAVNVETMSECSEVERRSVLVEDTPAPGSGGASRLLRTADRIENV